MLSAKGRMGEPPEWPLLAMPVQAHGWDLWYNMWWCTQAAMWEHLGQQIEVAMSVRELLTKQLLDDLRRVSVNVVHRLVQVRADRGQVGQEGPPNDGAHVPGTDPHSGLVQQS